MAEEVDEIRQFFLECVKHSWVLDGKEVKHFDKNLAISALLYDEKITAMQLVPEVLTDKSLVGQAVGLLIVEHDLFAWAYTAYVPLKLEDLESLYDHWAEDPKWGVEVWLCKQAGSMPQKAKAKDIKAAGYWDLDSMGLKENPN